MADVVPRRKLLCQLCELNIDETLRRILQAQNPSERIKPFVRVELVLSLAPLFRKLARLKTLGSFDLPSPE
jgi:hypothetical protein